MGAGKVLAGICAPFILGTGIGSVGQEIYYRSKMEGLEPHQVHVSWQDKKEIRGRTFDEAGSQDFSGFGNAYVSGKPLKDTFYEGRWVISPGKTLPKDLVFKEKPAVQFQSEINRENSNAIGLYCALFGLAGSVAAFGYAVVKKGDLIIN